MTDSLGTERQVRTRRARGMFPRWLGRSPDPDDLLSELAGTRQRLDQMTLELEEERIRTRELEARAEQLTALLEDEHRSRREVEESVNGGGVNGGALARPMSKRELRRRERELRRALKVRRKPLRRLGIRRRRRRH